MPDRTSQPQMLWAGLSLAGTRLSKYHPSRCFQCLLFCILGGVTQWVLNKLQWSLTIFRLFRSLLWYLWSTKPMLVLVLAITCNNKLISQAQYHHGTSLRSLSLAPQWKNLSRRRLSLQPECPTTVYHFWVTGFIYPLENNNTFLFFHFLKGFLLA